VSRAVSGKTGQLRAAKAGRTSTLRGEQLTFCLWEIFAQDDATIFKPEGLDLCTSCAVVLLAGRQTRGPFYLACVSRGTGRATRRVLVLLYVLVYAPSEVLSLSVFDSTSTR